MAKMYMANVGFKTFSKLIYNYNLEILGNSIKWDIHRERGFE